MIAVLMRFGALTLMEGMNFFMFNSRLGSSYSIAFCRRSVLPAALG